MYDSKCKCLTLQPESFEFNSEINFLTELENPFTEAEEMELAAELLAVTNEAEWEQFLGKLFKKAWRGIKSFGSKILRPIGGILRKVAKTALPFLATAAGTLFGGPAGGAAAGTLGSLVSRALEAETAGVAPIDRDFEKCRQFVRMAGSAVKAATLAPPGKDPIAVAKNLLAKSAQQKLTGNYPVIKATGAMSFPRRSCRCGKPWNCRCGKSGHWFRRGSDIVIINC